METQPMRGLGKRRLAGGRRRWLWLAVPLVVGVLVVTSLLRAGGSTTRPAAAMPTTVAPAPTTTAAPQQDRAAANGVPAAAGRTAAKPARDTTPLPKERVTSGGTTTSTFSTEQCRMDPTCPSSEHRTGDRCGGQLIRQYDGYLEGRRDAEAGLPYKADGAPAPTAADLDDDDGSVGPQTLYTIGYTQGWCDGGGRDEDRTGPLVNN